MPSSFWRHQDDRIHIYYLGPIGSLCSKFLEVRLRAIHRPAARQCIGNPMYSHRVSSVTILGVLHQISPLHHDRQSGEIRAITPVD